MGIKVRKLFVKRNIYQIYFIINFLLPEKFFS